MKKMVLTTLVLILLAPPPILLSQVSPDPGPRPGNIGDINPREDCINIVINDVISPFWDTNKCENHPDDESVYANNYIFILDVKKHVTVPYVEDNPPNPNINNHKFWYTFGVDGQIFCVDDLNQAAVGLCDDVNHSLKVCNINTDFETSIWIDFMTQCENCSNMSGSDGLWHKFEQEFEVDELAGDFNNCSNIWLLNKTMSSEVVLDFQSLVTCEIVDVYGCQSNENNGGY